MPSKCTAVFKKQLLHTDKINGVSDSFLVNGYVARLRDDIPLMYQILEGYIYEKSDPISFRKTNIIINNRYSIKAQNSRRKQSFILKSQWAFPFTCFPSHLLPRDIFQRHAFLQHFFCHR